MCNEALDRSALNAKRKRWLEFHDQKTGGIMSLLPLIKGLPVRSTDHIDRNLGLYKQTKCTIHGWTLNINEARTSLVARTHLIHCMCLFNATRECCFFACSVESLSASFICPSPHAVQNQLCCGTCLQASVTRRPRALLSYVQHSRLAHHACVDQHTSTRRLRRTESSEFWSCSQT